MPIIIIQVEVFKISLLRNFILIIHISFSSDGFQITAPSNHPHKRAANLNQIGGRFVTVGSRENVSHAESFKKVPELLKT